LTNKVNNYVVLPRHGPLHDVLAEQTVEVEDTITAVNCHSSLTGQSMKCTAHPRNHTWNKRATNDSIKQRKSP